MIQQFLIDLCEIFLEKKPKYLATFKAILKTITFASGYCGFLLDNFWLKIGQLLVKNGRLLVKIGQLLIPRSVYTVLCSPFLVAYFTSF